MSKYGEQLYWHIRRMVVAHDDAEDCLQETMINVYKYRSTYSRTGPVLHYRLMIWVIRLRRVYVRRQAPMPMRL